MEPEDTFPVEETEIEELRKSIQDNLSTELVERARRRLQKFLESNTPEELQESFPRRLAAYTNQELLQEILQWPGALDAFYAIMGYHIQVRDEENE